MSEVQKQVPVTGTNHPKQAVMKFFGYSLIGIFMFFLPISINGSSSIPLDHLVTFLRNGFPTVVSVYIFVIIAFGAIQPFVNRSWKKSTVTKVLSFFKVIGLIVAFMLYLDIGPNWLFSPDMGPFLMESLVTPVGVLVPIGAIFLALLVSYGLLESVGVLLQPMMRPIWKTPGRSAIDAVASFVGSYSLGLLITNRVFKEGKYTEKEAAIIATGFSTVSVTFMVVVANTLGLMEKWNTYFWVTLVVTFLITAITVRIWPLNKMSERFYADQKGDPEAKVERERFKVAWQQAMKVAEHAPSIYKNIWLNLKDGLMMTMSILPSILSVGLLGLVLAEFTFTFDILGYIFYPFTWIMQVPEPLMAAKAAAMEIAEMFLPALYAAEGPLVMKFVIGTLSVSAILFFSATIPVILSTEIPISIPKLLVIWIERTILTIIIVTPIAYVLL
ncbi:YjiH family protein [Virgibacillus salexigens]|uniref:YjiH family protein n=1 Tax=Virgibacillus salexigens TaxID=61016 RepID=UPI003081D65E